jgi:hypothetical protein
LARDSRKLKQAILSQNPSVSKVPKFLGAPNLEGDYIAWRFGTADIDGPYSCANMDAEDYQRLWERLRAFEGMNASALKGAGSLHPVPMHKMSREAKDRLKQMQLDDLDGLHSFHVTGSCRFWCMKHLNIFCLLWWDRDHRVYPTPKSHT